MNIASLTTPQAHLSRRQAVRASEESVTAHTHLSPSRKPYIYLSFGFGRRQLFLIPKRSTILDPDGEYRVTTRSPHARRNEARLRMAKSRTATRRTKHRAR